MFHNFSTCFYFDFSNFPKQVHPPQKKNNLNPMEKICNFNNYMSYGRNYLIGEYAISKYGGPLSVVRVLYVPDINIKAGDLHCGMIWFATWSRLAGERAKMREFLVPFDSKGRWHRWL